MVARRLGQPELARQAEEVAERTFELSQLRVDVVGVTDVGAYFPHRVVYHPTCHSLRLLRVGDRPLVLLRNVAGIDLVPLPDAEACCGFGGTFAGKNADVPTAMLAAQMRTVHPTGAEPVQREAHARGGTVHWGRDATEANQIETELVRSTGATEVVKVKSLATDEIGLNDALADAGIQAVETDLAELIVQLGHDRPSHILVPAIHRNRSQIRDIFLREMGDVDPGLTDEPSALADAARRPLRRKFLSATVGDSGTNFAAAVTCQLCHLDS